MKCVLILDISVTGEIDASTLLKVGTNNTEYANNYIRFKPAGAAYIDHNTVGQDINFRTSVSSSLDTTPFVIKSGGNLKAETKLGIGIDPVEILDVKSASGDARIRLDAPSGSDTEIKFFNAGSAQYTIGHDDATDNFVIGGVNVDAPLVTVSKAGIVKIASTGSLNFDGGSDGNANIDYHIGGNYMKFVTNSSSASMRFHTSSSTDPRMIILANGNVGIGETTPQYPLHVQGSNVTSGGGLATMAVVDNGTAYNATNPGGGITFRGIYNSGGNATNFATMQGIKENATDGNYDTALRFTTRSHDGNLIEKMRITSDGKVGIGTDTPSVNLEVIDPVSGNFDGKIHIGGNGSSRSLY